jgi:Protein kinase domain
MPAMRAPTDRFGLAGARLAGRYRVEGQVAEGGFAVVYRAVQIALERPIALKVLKTPPGLGEAARARFERRFETEARTIAKLQHPFIVDVHDYGVSPMPSGEPAPWMALEWLDGETLERDLDRRRGAGGRTMAEAVALLRPVIDAVAYAHRRGIVHRDIKPANLMIVDGEGGPMLRMLDFGIAKIMEGDPIGDTRPGRGSGGPGFSPDYAAPEQITYSRTGPWTDVHALGLLLTELLTDEPPFAAARGPAGDEQLFEQIMSADRPTPARKAVDAGALEKIIARALALSPGQRWKDAGELLEAVDARVGGAAVGGPARRRASRGRSRLERRLRAAAANVTKVLASRPWRRVRAAIRDTGATLRVRRPADLATPVSGGVAILSVFVALVWAAASGGGRTRGSFVRAPVAAAVAPWIVPIPACASGAADGASFATTTVEPPVAARRPGRVPRPAIPPPQEDEVVEGDACLVSINSVPWSEVWIDGKYTGRHTPFVRVEVGCGVHLVDFKRPDLQIAERERITVRPGRLFKHTFTLPGDAE